MGKKKGISKIKIIQILEPYFPLKDHRKIIKAYQALIGKHPKLITFERFKLVHAKSTDVSDLADLIFEQKNKKERLTREDDDQWTKNKKYKGRKKLHIGMFFVRLG